MDEGPECREVVVDCVFADFLAALKPKVRDEKGVNVAHFADAFLVAKRKELLECRPEVIQGTIRDVWLAFFQVSVNGFVGAELS